MLSNFVVSLVFGLGVAAWMYSRYMRRTGGNSQSALTVAGVSGLAGLIIFWIILSIILH